MTPGIRNQISVGCRTRSLPAHGGTKVAARSVRGEERVREPLRLVLVEPEPNLQGQGG